MPFARSALLSCAIAVCGARAGWAQTNLPAVLDRISAQSMRGHVSFLASDLLAGRATPSSGLDVAAEYIAAQFRRAGLEPVGDSGYFQTARFIQFDADKRTAKLELESGGKRVAAEMENATILATAPVSLTDAPAIKFTGDDLAEVERLKHSDVDGKVVALYLTRGFGGFRTYGAIRKLRPAVLIVVGPGVPRDSRPRMVAADERDSQTPAIFVRAGEFVKSIEQAKSGPGDLKATVQVGEPAQREIPLRNVAGLLRGSDPVLKDTYLLVTAHYDHMGVKTEGEGDRIFNGANDDASGTASVIEIASALATMNPKPKRSILFMAVFGEELGLLGSQYYGRHPLFPLANTIGDINLEHLGRTDANDGPKIASASFTGFDYSGLPAVFEKAGERVGVKVYKDEKRSDSFFARSDNQALADLGIPAHTLCVTFEFPDYHGVGDEWPKLDYDNMAKIDRMVALGLLTLADMDQAPQWNEAAAKAKPYVAASKALHSGAQ